MKLSFLALTFLLVLVSCGKNNESGRPTLIKQISPYTAEEEISIRQDFVRKGTELLRIYEHDMKRVLGLRTVGLIRNKLKYDHVLVTHQYLYDRDHRYTRSNHRNDSITLYIGRDRRELDWGYIRTADYYTRYVMNELLQLGNVDDFDFRLTDRILSRQ